MPLLARIYEHVQTFVNNNPARYGEDKDAKDVHWVLCRDVYSVHIKESVRDKIKQLYPNCHVLYIPGECTALLQALDLAFNFPFKRCIGGLFNQYLVEQMTSILINKRPDEAAGSLGVRLSTLKGPFVH